MGNVACLFCLKTAKRAKEHVWPLWLQEALDVRDNVAAWVHHSIVGGVVSRRVQNTGSILLGDVCANCNNGWMSELEGRASPVVRRLLDGLIGTTVSAADAAALGLWAFKTAIVVNGSSNYRRVVPVGHFEHIFKQREIPPHVAIDVAHFPDGRRLTSLQSQHFIGMVTGDSQAALTRIRDAGYNIVLGVGNVAFRVAHLPVAGHTIVADLEHPNRTRRLWPTTGPVTFDLDSSFDELVEFEMSVAFRHEG